MAKKPLSLFSGFGVELEYMIVDNNKLNVKPISDKLIHEIAKEYISEVTLGKIALSNELALHVVEFKNSKPTKNLASLFTLFHESITKINNILHKFNASLLPTGSHPWMNPYKETKLWPHECNPIYETYNKIFNCRGHGWSNLQSVHLNLPFANDKEFAKLHSAIRLVLPIIPALTASTPIIDGKPTGFLDSRLNFYFKNQEKIPSISGNIIPEVIFTKKEYEKKILQRMYKDIAAHDPSGIVQHEWLNSRGAIARFDRNTIEIRIIDTQECPLVDISILILLVETLKTITEEKWITFNKQSLLQENELKNILLDVIKSGQSAVISNPKYLLAFGYNKSSCTAKQLWLHIVENLLNLEKINDDIFLDVIKTILFHGNLSERILSSLNGNFSKEKLFTTYQNLADCLKLGKMYKM